MATTKHKNLHWYVRVQGEGSITVVIETAWGSFSPEWWNIQNQLSQYTRVVTYDRAGYGWSGRAELPRTPTRIAHELRAVLTGAGITGPFLLLGHSLGGLNMQQFARLFPNDTIGVVFVDPVSMDNHRFKAELPSHIYRGSGVDKHTGLHWMRWLARLRLLGWLKSIMLKSPPFYYYKTITLEQRDVVWQHYQRSDTYLVAADEYEQAFSPDARAALSEHPFPSIPIVVIYHDAAVVIKEIVKYGGLGTAEAGLVETLWQELTRSYLALSTRSQWQVASEASHMIHLDRPDLIIATVTEMITAQLAAR